MEYFELFDMPPSFLPDESLLRKRFLQLSRQHHPDFHSLAPPAVQAAALEKSTRLNEAYVVLSDFNARMEYILRQEGCLTDSDRNDLPPEFLQDMMEVNELLMELEFDSNPELLSQIRTQILGLESSERRKVEASLTGYDNPDTDRNTVLRAAKDFHLKQKYVWRIKEKIDKFAAASDGNNNLGT
jgi:molecular chaperone HscB